MSRYLHKSLVWMVAGILLASCPSGAGADETVTVVGSSWLQGLSDDAAAEIAKSEAKRRALERAGRTSVMQHTSTRNAALLSDAVVTQSEGVFTRLQWGRIWKEQGKIFVELTATVSSDRLRGDFMAIDAALKQKGLPRIGLVIPTKVLGHTEGGAPALTAFSEGVQSGIKSYFMSTTPEMNIVFRDAATGENAVGHARLFNPASHGDLSGNIAHEEIRLKDGEQATQQAAALSRELGVDLVVVGEIVLQPVMDTVRGQRVMMLTVTPRLQAVDAASGKTLALNHHSYTLGPVAASRAQQELSNSLVQIGQREGAALLGQLVRHWCTSRSMVKLILRDATPQMVEQFRLQLEAIGGEQNFQLRSLRNGIAHVDFFTDLPPQRLSGILGGMKSAQFLVEDMPEGMMILSPNPDAFKHMSSEQWERHLTLAILVTGGLMLVFLVLVIVFAVKRKSTQNEGSAQ